MPRRVGVVVWPDLAGIGTGDEQRRRRRSGHHRDRARKHQTARNNLRSNRIGIPRRLAVALDQMVAGNTAGDELWRQRARDVDGNYARRHGEVCACVRWVPESTRNTMSCSREHDGDHGHGGEAIRGDVLTATATGQLRCARGLTEMGGRWGAHRAARKMARGGLVAAGGVAGVGEERRRPEMWKEVNRCSSASELQLRPPVDEEDDGGDDGHAGEVRWWLWPRVSRRRVHGGVRTWWGTRGRARWI